MIDVHIILLGDENPEWLAQCIQSLRDEPVTLHLVAGVRGHIGQGRAEGFSRGVHPYVAYVDPDDYALPGAYARMREALERDPSADLAYMRDGYVTADGGIEPFDNELHHACVYRRAFIDACLPAIRREPLTPERFAEPAAKKRVFIDAVGYAYRDYEDSAYKTLHRQMHPPPWQYQTFEEFRRGN